MVESSFICGLQWAVRLTDSPVAANDRVVHGVCDKPMREIHVSRAEACEDHLRSSLVHEHHHAAIATVLNTFPDDEEALVTGMEVGWYSMFRDPRNLWFFKKVTEGVFDVKLARKRERKDASGGKK